MKWAGFRVLFVSTPDLRPLSQRSPTPVMASFICWCHVLLGRPRRLVGLPDIASYITLRVTMFASRLWTCPNQRRRPLRITSSIGESGYMRRIVSLACDPVSTLRGSHVNLHGPAFAPIRQIRCDYFFNNI